MKGYSWLLGVVGFFILMFFVNKIFIATKNDGNKYCQQYIDNSSEIKIKLPDDLQEIFHDYGSFITGLWGRGSRSSRYSSLTFFNTDYQNFFCIYIFGYYSSNTTSVLGINILPKKTITAKINQNQLIDKKYGTKDNPIPIFSFTLPAEIIENLALGDDGYRYELFLEGEQAQLQYESAVKLYLTYVMSKEEFKERFEKVEK